MSVNESPVHPRTGTPPWAGTPGQVHPQQVHPLSRYTPRQCMLGYGQHPTGMHSCLYNCPWTLLLIARVDIPLP